MSEKFTVLGLGMKKQQERERTLLFKSFRGDFHRSTEKKKFHKGQSGLRDQSSLPASVGAPSRIAPFAFLADFGLENLLPYFHIRHVQAGETIWHEDEPSLFLAFVDRGKIKLTKSTEFNNHQVVVGVIGKGSLIGDFSMTDGNCFSTTATAMEYSLLGLLDLEKIQEILVDNSELGVRLLKEMLNSNSSQLCQAFDRLIHLF